MPEFLTKLQNQAKDFWKNLDKSQRNKIIAISAIIMIATTAFIIIVTKPNYVPLIKSADPKDIGEMTKVLDNSKIKYTLKDNGTSIYINASDNNKAQVTLLQNGYPKTGMSFEDAFNMIKINTTESDKEKLWENYKKSTLIAKLKMFDNVEDADVDLAIPETSYFLTQDNNTGKTTAYVRVTPKGELTPEQVQGIVDVVSHSVVNLDPKDVTVVDNNLNVLNSDTGDQLADNTNSQDKMRQQRTDEIEKKVYDLFNNGQVDNFDTIRVIANPVLDFDTMKSTTQGIANPSGMDSGALIHDVQSNEQVTNPTGASGAPGTSSNPGTGNIPSYPTGSSQNGNYTKTTKDETYDYTRTVTEQEKALGNVITTQSSMTVLLYYGRRVADDSKLTTAFINQLKSDVSTATGIPTANISINKYKLAPIQVTQETLGEKLSKLINSYGFFLLMLLLIIGLMIAAIPKRKKEAVMEEDEIVAGQVAAATSGPRFIVPEASNEHIPEIELEERSEVKKQIEKFVKQKPDAVAQLLRNWLSEDWD